MKKGFTLVEVLVSVAILSVVSASIFPVLGWMISKSKQYQYDNEAATVLLEGVEGTYNYMVANEWDGLTPGSNYRLSTNAAGDKWILEPGAPATRLGRFDQWVTLSRVCRHNETGDYLVKVGDTCESNFTDDEDSRVVTVNVTWSEKSGLVPKTAQLLVVKI